MIGAKIFTRAGNPSSCTPFIQVPNPPIALPEPSVSKPVIFSEVH